MHVVYAILPSNTSIACFSLFFLSFKLSFPQCSTTFHLVSFFFFFLNTSTNDAAIRWLDVWFSSLCPNTFQIVSFVAASTAAPHRCVLLLKSEYKAITHWRVCLNHTEWLWILNVRLRPTHRGNSVGEVLIRFYFIFWHKLLISWIALLVVLKLNHIYSSGGKQISWISCFLLFKKEIWKLWKS